METVLAVVVGGLYSGSHIRCPLDSRDVGPKPRVSERSEVPGCLPDPKTYPGHWAEE
jgi:hypothetical protein